MSQPRLPALNLQPATPPPGRPAGPHSTPNRALPVSQSEPDIAQPAQASRIDLVELSSKLAELQLRSSAQPATQVFSLVQMDPSNPTRQSSPSQNGRSGSTGKPNTKSYSAGKSDSKPDGDKP